MLKQKFLLSSVFEILIYLLSFFSLIVITRNLGPEPIGLISSSLAIMSLFSIISNLGLGVAHVKLISQGEDENECVSTFLFLKFLTTFLMAIFFVIAFNLNLIPGFKPKTLESNVLLIIFVSSLINSFNDVGNFTLSGRLKIFIGKGILLTQKLVNSFLKILVALQKKNVIWLAFVEIITNILGTFLYILAFKNIKFKTPSKKLLMKYFSFGIPSLVISINAILFSNVLDKIIINSFFDAKEVGYYSVALSSLIFFTLASNNLNNLLLPYFSRLFSENMLQRVTYISLKLEKFIAIVFIPLIFFFIFNSYEFVLLLFGENMLKTAIILPFLIINLFIFTLNRPLATKILGKGNFKFIMWIDIIYGLLNIFFLLILIPDKFLGIKLVGLGSVGAAISLSFSNLIIYAIYKIYTVKHLSDKFQLPLFGPIFISFLSFYLINNFTFMITENIVLIFLINLIIGFSFYIVLCFSLRIITKDELKELTEIFSLKKISFSIKKEFDE